MTPRTAPARPKATGKSVPRHELTFRDVPPGLTRCLRCEQLLTVRDLLVIPYCRRPMRG